MSYVGMKPGPKPKERAVVLPAHPDRKCGDCPHTNDVHDYSGGVKFCYICVVPCAILP